MIYVADKLILVRITEPPQIPVLTQTQRQPSVAARTGRLLQGMFSSMLSKGIVLGVSAMSIPITARYPGPELRRVGNYFDRTINATSTRSGCC
jgi:hypothetical protein